jgi:hypothetical protein
VSREEGRGKREEESPAEVVVSAAESVPEPVSGKGAKKARRTKKEKPQGFGFDPAEAQHHFLVTIPASGKDPQVYVTEHLEWDDSEARRELNFALGREDNKMRVVLPRAKWDAIADAARAEFNQRLKALGKKPGQWAAGQVPMARTLGKELVLLCWAIEEADPALIPAAIRNWLGLAPEERWWLFTMTNAATGHAITGRGKGWRRAVRYALTENPVAEGAAAPTPQHYASEDNFGLFSVLEPADRPWATEALKTRKK